MESMCWGAVYLLLGALPDARQAILYSLNAMTAFGHITFELADQWKLMGALEALNGLLLFGLTTAFLYGHLQRVWPRDLVLPAHAPTKNAATDSGATPVP